MANRFLLKPPPSLVLCFAFRNTHRDVSSYITLRRVFIGRFPAVLRSVLTAAFHQELITQNMERICDKLYHLAVGRYCRRECEADGNADEIGARDVRFCLVHYGWPAQQTRV